ncbi:MAG TPA: VWA domain-containing protein [Pyrinomonadaceae bacterium]|nr:VWA domain-containing protein [Pyrinomonadaceae bacterium]
MNRERRNKLGTALLLAALSLFCCFASAAAQKIIDMPPPPPLPTPKPTPTPAPPKDDDFEVIKVSSNLVMVPVSVVDATGAAVRGLQVSDFRLEEEGREQQITEIGNPDEVPLDIVILFDVSSSVSQKGFFEFQQSAAASFLKQVLKPVDRAAVFTISDAPKLFSPLAPADVTAAKILSIPAATTPVPTAFYDTVMAASKYLMDNSAERHRRVILVISDGDDNFSSLVKDLSVAEYRASQKGEVTSQAAHTNLLNRRQRAVLEVQRSVQTSDAAFYSINPGGPSIHLNEISTRAQNAMESIAQSTGGSAYVPEAERDLPRVFNQIGAELRGQYLVQYYSNSPVAGVQFRRIAVALPTHAELRVRARQGYYPKSK